MPSATTIGNSGTSVRALRRRVSALEVTAIVYALAMAFHAADHVHRGLGQLTPEVFWAGMVSTGAALGAVALVLCRSRLGAFAAASTGFANALGVAAVHLALPWGPFSDSFPGHGAAPSSWAAVCVEIAAACAFGLAGLRDLRGDPVRPRATPEINP